MMWETVVVSLILIGMLIALVRGGDKLNQWTFMRGGSPKPLEMTVYGLTRSQIRALRAFYISRTGDTHLERL